METEGVRYLAFIVVRSRRLRGEKRMSTDLSSCMRQMGKNQLFGDRLLIASSGMAIRAARFQHAIIRQRVFGHRDQWGLMARTSSRISHTLGNG
ncbi:MAG TPA: hypothetical protein VMX97_15800, partial [Hyphomicrobiaceae bacterium]|nr:hypothetical protein [Hyphomicrobiaceae bacterium]